MITMGTNTRHFKLDSSTPLRKQVGERDSAYKLFLRWKELGWCSDEELAADNGKVSWETVRRYRVGFKWAERRGLYLARQQQPLGERMYGQANARKKSTAKPLRKADGEVVLPPPPPIKRGLHAFALQWGYLICPGWESDPLVDLMLTHLEELVEGDSGGRLLINPPPRSSKTTCCILALCYSLLRYPDRGHALISANGRLASMNNQSLRTLFEHAVPEGYGIDKGTKSKLAWKPNWQGAREQLALSRGGAMLGYTVHLGILDDLCGQVSDIESPEIMAATMRTMGTDITTRLTKDKAGKGAAMAIVAQRLGPTDPTAELINRARGHERDGLPTTPYKVIASPFLNPSPERAAEIVGDYPNSWQVFQPSYGIEGDPVSHRFDRAFADRLQAELPPNDFAAMYLLDCSRKVGFCAWKPSYIREIEEDDARVQATMMAIDFGLTEGGDRSALTVVGTMDGHVVILGLHFLQGQIEDMFSQVVDYAKRYNVHTVGIENAAAGDFIFRGLNSNIGDRHFNVVKLSHGGKNKAIRQSAMLGWAANGKLLAVKGLAEMQTLQEQMRVIATHAGKGKKADDLADSCVHACNWAWEHWVKSGFSATGVSWQGGAGDSGVTTCSWGYGAPQKRSGLDGVSRYIVWD